MMIHGYSMLKNLKQSAAETKQSFGIPHLSYLCGNHTGILWWVVPDNRIDCSTNWSIFRYFYDRKCDYEENKDESSVH